MDETTVNLIEHAFLHHLRLSRSFPAVSSFENR
jgi:hypothetical protein